MYPPFEESKNKLCRRVAGFSEKRLDCSCGESFAFASPDLSKQIRDLCKVGDWIGLEIDSKKKIKAVEVLAPHLKDIREPQVEIQTLREWNLFLKTIRNFFEKKGFLEVQTPTLVVCPGTEPFLDSFETKFQQGKKQTSYSLPTSPELHLKKLVAAGYGPLFEMRPCFRNGEVSSKHQPEFWMLEWYRPGQNLKAIQKDCIDLVKVCAKALKRKAPRKIESSTMARLFQQEIGFQLTPQTKAPELIQKARSLGIVITDDFDFDDAFYLLFLEKIEPHISENDLVFVHDYPPSQAALARVTSEGWGDRFEMYWKGFELANAYHELNDPNEQRVRSLEDLRKRERLSKPSVQLDEGFFESLESGMPPTAGIALGLERLFLALTGRKSLDEIRLFPMRSL